MTFAEKIDRCLQGLNETLAYNKTRGTEFKHDAPIGILGDYTQETGPRDLNNIKALVKHGQNQLRQILGQMRESMRGPIEGGDRTRSWNLLERAFLETTYDCNEIRRRMSANKSRATIDGYCTDFLTVLRALEQSIETHGPELVDAPWSLSEHLSTAKSIVANFIDTVDKVNTNNRVQPRSGRLPGHIHRPPA